MSLVGPDDSHTDFTTTSCRMLGFFNNWLWSELGFVLLHIRHDEHIMVGVKTNCHGDTIKDIKYCLFTINLKIRYLPHKVATKLNFSDF